MAVGIGGYLAETGDQQSQTSPTNRTAIGMGLISASFAMAVFGTYLWVNYPPQKDVRVGLSSSGVLLEGRF